MTKLSFKSPKIPKIAQTKVGAFKMPSFKSPSIAKYAKVSIPKAKKLAIVKAKVQKHVRF